MDENAPAYLQGNVDGWQEESENFIQPANDAWAAAQPYWGIWRIPNTEIRLLPASMSNLRCIELGCGTAYVSAWMCQRGAQVTAIDPTPNQLHTAMKLQQEHKLQFKIEAGYAETLTFPDGSFDFAISEYGASLWSDPYRWIPEAARVLRVGGTLTFLTNSPLMVMCTPERDADGPTGAELLRPYFGMHEYRWPDTPTQTEFHLAHGEWIDLLRANGFSIERLVELQAPEDSVMRYPWVSPEWARQWPSEEVWVVVKKEKRITS